jgi:hypothetical protein
MIPILHVLIGEVTVDRHFVTIRTICPSFAISFDEKRTDVRTIAFVIWVCSRELF